MSVDGGAQENKRSAATAERGETSETNADRHPESSRWDWRWPISDLRKAIRDTRAAGLSTRARGIAEQGREDRRDRHPRHARRSCRVPRPSRQSVRAHRNDPNSNVQLALGSVGVPETFIVDGKGVIRYQHVGPIEPRRRARHPRQAGGGAVKALALSLALLLAGPALAQSNMPPSYWAYRQLPDAKQEAQGAGADAGASLPGLPRSVDRGFRRRACRRYARSRPAADRGGRKARGHPRLADRALRRLGQLSSFDRPDRMAAVGGTDPPADLSAARCVAGRLKGKRS